MDVGTSTAEEAGDPAPTADRSPAQRSLALEIGERGVWNAPPSNREDDDWANSDGLFDEGSVSLGASQAASSGRPRSRKSERTVPKLKAKWSAGPVPDRPAWNGALEPAVAGVPRIATISQLETQKRVKARKRALAKKLERIRLEKEEKPQPVVDKQEKTQQSSPQHSMTSVFDITRSALEKAKAARSKRRGVSPLLQALPMHATDTPVTRPSTATTSPPRYVAPRLRTSGSSIFSGSQTSNWKSTPSFSLAGRPTSTLSFMSRPGAVTAPSPLNYNPIEGYHKVYVTGDTAAHPADKLIYENVPQEPSGPVTHTKIPSFTDNSSQRGFSLASRQLTDEERAILCGHPQTPAPGGTYQVLSFAEESVRRNKGLDFGKHTTVQKPRIVPDVAPTPTKLSVPSFAEDNKRHGKGFSLGGREKTSMAMMQERAAQIPAPGRDGIIPDFIHEATRLHKGVQFASHEFSPGGSEPKRPLPLDRIPGPGAYDILPAVVSPSS